LERALKDSMLVQCPSCHTTFRVSENAVTAPKPTFRCSRCKNVFVLGAKAGHPARAPSQPTTSAPRREKAAELSFSFPAPEPHDTEREKMAAISNSATPGNGPAPASGQNEASLIIPPKRGDDWSIARERGADESFTMSGERSFAEFDKPSEQPFRFARERDKVAKQGEPAQATVAPASSRPLSITPYFLLSGIMLFFFSGVTAVYKAKPALIESSLRAVPWIGSSVLRNDHLRQGIALQTSRPRFQRIQGNREIFLLSGVAVNRNRVRVREIKIEGYIFGSDGKVIERQVITVGNAISSKIVRDLTHQEISDLQKQGPVKRFEILPDESAPFSIVFLKSNPDIQSFGYRVLSAEEA
jgi:predicted Zn finger-like uncharacterized protein